MRVVKLNGIIDELILEQALSLDIRHLGFDFRPTSFQFLQHYRFLELLDKFYSPELRFYLHFCDEQDFVIQKFIEDCDELLKTKPGYLGLSSHLSLEFSDRGKSSFYRKFQLPHLWHYREDALLSDYLESQYLSGLELNFSELEEVRLYKPWEIYCLDLLKQIKPKPGHTRVSLLLHLDWDQSPFDSLFDLLPIDLISLDINQKVEQSYRHVDFDKLKNGILHFQKVQL
jgi:hypothetical protein